jgi:uncharacterized protein (TIGR03067 family)
MSNCFPIQTAAVILLLFAATAARADEPAKPAAGQDAGFKPEQLVGAWKLVSGEKGAKPMAKDSTGGIFVFTKDTLTGKNRSGDELSWMSYTLDTTKKPVAMKLTITKGFVGVTADAIVEIRDGKLLLCYGKEPTSFVTKEGENNRSMVFVKSVDPGIVRKEVETASEKRWQAIRDQYWDGYIAMALVKEFIRTGPDAKRRTLNDLVFESSPKKKLDAVTVSDQIFRILGDTVVESGRAVGTKKDVKEPVWDVWYTTTWIREDGKWRMVNEHQSPAK